MNKSQQVIESIQSLNEGTRSIIGIEDKKGQVTYIYCNYDGYLEHNGKILKNHYTNLKKVKELMKLGDLSVLGKDIGKKQDFNNPTDGWCLAYGRDRGEKNTSAVKVRSRDQIKEQEYNYLFKEEENKWIYKEVDGEWEDL